MSGEGDELTCGARDHRADAPPYLSATKPGIFAVSDIVPHGSYLCSTRGGPPDVGCDQDGEDRVDPSPRDHQIRHLHK